MEAIYAEIDALEPPAAAMQAAGVEHEARSALGEIAAERTIGVRLPSTRGRATLSARTAFAGCSPRGRRAPSEIRPQPNAEVAGDCRAPSWSAHPFAAWWWEVVLSVGFCDFHDCQRLVYTTQRISAERPDCGLPLSIEAGHRGF